MIWDTVIHHRLSSLRYDVRFEVVIMANGSSSGMHPIHDGEQQLLCQPSIFAPRHTQEDNSHRSWPDWQFTPFCCWEHIIQWRTVRSKQPSTSSELREVKKKSAVPSLYQNMHFITFHYTYNWPIRKFFVTFTVLIKHIPFGFHSQMKVFSKVSNLKNGRKTYFFPLFLLNCPLSEQKFRRYVSCSDIDAGR